MGNFHVGSQELSAFWLKGVLVSETSLASFFSWSPLIFSSISRGSFRRGLVVLLHPTALWIQDREPWPWLLGACAASSPLLLCNVLDLWLPITLTSTLTNIYYQRKLPPIVDILLNLTTSFKWGDLASQTFCQKTKVVLLNLLSKLFAWPLTLQCSCWQYCLLPKHNLFHT